MAKDIREEIHGPLRKASPARLRFTRRAFEMIPKLDSPRILDVGCGSSGVTIELAKLTRGEVVGLDIDRSALDALSVEIREAELAERVHLVNRSMFEMNFADGSFDIVWSEGSVHIIGFERALKEWRRFIGPMGFFVIHEMVWLRANPPREIESHWRMAYPGIRTAPEYVGQVESYGYNLIGQFSLPDDFWWLDYYGPLQERIGELRKKYAQDQEALKRLDEEQREVDLYRKHSKWYGSAFFVVQKAGEEVRTRSE